METEDVRSSSSLSSSEWEDLGSDLSHGEFDGREVGRAINMYWFSLFNVKISPKIEMKFCPYLK